MAAENDEIKREEKDDEDDGDEDARYHKDTYLGALSVPSELYWLVKYGLIALHSLFYHDGP